MLYRNNSNVVKTFYGIVFQPGAVEKVPGYINDRDFERVNAKPKEPPKRVDSSKTSTKGKPKLTKEETPSGTDNDQ